MHLVGHLLTYIIDIRFHYGRGALGDFGLVGCGEEFSDMLRDLRGHVGWCRFILISICQRAKGIAKRAFWGHLGHDSQLWRWRHCRYHLSSNRAVLGLLQTE